MSITTVCTAIKTLFQSNLSSTITTAFDPPPLQIDTEHLPATYTLVDRATDTWEMGNDIGHEQRRYRVQIAVMPVGQNNLVLAQQQCRTLIPTIKGMFASHPRLGGAYVTVAGDSGIIVLAPYGEKFIGFEVRLEVAAYNKRTYATGE